MRMYAVYLFSVVKYVVTYVSHSHLAAAAVGMIRSIATYRSMHGLPPLRCVRLDNVVGQYWRFHEEGNSALSTIEAITYTASSAGLSEDDCHKLLTLFRVQKGRVLLSMEHGAKKPRAVCVSGTGDGNWKNVVIAPLPEDKPGGAVENIVFDI